MKKRMASFTVFDYYGYHQVRIADILGLKSSKPSSGTGVMNKDNNPLYLQLLRIPPVK